MAAWKVATTGYRFVDMEHVKPALAQPAAYPCGTEGPEVHPGHRPVVANRHGGPGTGEFDIGKVGDVEPFGRRSEIAGSQDIRSMTGVAQVPREAEDVILYAAGDVEGVRTHNADAQRGARAGHRASSTGGS
jgi:hypothetical protein